MSMGIARSKAAPKVNSDEALLANIFSRSGCFRIPDPERRKREGQRYKKGYEVRLAVGDDTELSAVRRSLKRLGMKPGESYQKHRRTIQILYGKQPVAAFIRLLEKAGVKSDKLVTLEGAS